MLLQHLIGWASDSAYACARARNQARNEGMRLRNNKYALAHPFVPMIGFEDGDVIKVSLHGTSFAGGYGRLLDFSHVCSNH